ncbi:hypothetical protein [Kitasatospora sp. NPDC057198]|uniref:hypothetical protein n=1 Tax=Kitasatospora sp. NPDC057198 TaxID=3346046 RepID=UPI00363DEE88
MSDRYELFLAVDLAPDLSEEELAEVRWLLGQGEPPALPTASADEPWAAFEGGGSPSIEFAGADVALLVPAPERRRTDGGVPWALTVRSCFLEEALTEVLEIAGWLLERSVTVGRVGHLRGESEGEGDGTFRALVRDRDGFELVDARSGASVLRTTWR